MFLSTCFLFLSFLTFLLYFISSFFSLFSLCFTPLLSLSFLISHLSFHTCTHYILCPSPLCHVKSAPTEAMHSLSLRNTPPTINDIHIKLDKLHFNTRFNMWKFIQLHPHLFISISTHKLILNYAELYVD